MLALRIIIGVIIILISIFAMCCKIGHVLGVLGAIIMAIVWGASETWLTTFWACGTETIMLIVFGLFAGSLIVGVLMSQTLGSIMGGIGGISCGVLTLGVMNADVLNGIMEVAITPLLGIGALVAIAALFFVWLFTM